MTKSPCGHTREQRVEGGEKGGKVDRRTSVKGLPIRPPKRSTERSGEERPGGVVCSQGGISRGSR